MVDGPERGGVMLPVEQQARPGVVVDGGAQACQRGGEAAVGFAPGPQRIAGD